MNKIFKVIWNHATQSWVAVSELSKAHGKTKSTTTAAAVAAVLVGMSSANAANYVDGPDNVIKPNSDSVIIGTNNKIDTATQQFIVGANNDIAQGTNNFLIGTNVTFAGARNGVTDSTIVARNSKFERGTRTVAFGDNLFIGGRADLTTVIGNDIQLTSQVLNSTYIGNNINGKGGRRDAANRIIPELQDKVNPRANFVVAIGNNVSTAPNVFDRDAEESIIIGNHGRSASRRGTVIGTHAYAGHTEATAIGSLSVAMGYGATAIGTNTYAAHHRGVAIGDRARVLQHEEYGYTDKYYAQTAAGAGNGSNRGGIAIGNQADTLGYESITLGYRAGTGDAGTTNDKRFNATFIRFTAEKFRDLDDATKAELVAKNKGLVGAVAVGSYAYAQSGYDIALGSKASTANSTVTGTADGLSRQTAIGSNATTGAYEATAIAAFSRALANQSVAIGANATAGTGRATDEGLYSISIGKDSNVTGNSSIAVGVGNIVTGNYSGTFGDPTVNNGDWAYTVGNDNAVGQGSNNVTISGNQNQVGAQATFDGTTGRLAKQQALKKVTPAVDVGVVGNRNHVETNGTYILGSGIGTKGTPGTAGFGFINTPLANSVYLGDDSSSVDAPGNQEQKDSVLTATSTSAGIKGIVNNATVNGVTYEGFQGKKAVGVVAVGAGDYERRIVNVAAGEISRTSTDAINGSQLYAVMDKLGPAAPLAVAPKGGSPEVPAVPANPATNTPAVPAIPAAPEGKVVTPTVAEGPKFVNATTVADTINNSGFIVGKNEKPPVTYNNEDEKVSPGDELRFADGKNTRAKVGTTETDGKSVTTVAVDVDLPVVYTDKAGNQVVRKGDQYFTVNPLNGLPTTTEVAPEDVVASMAKPKTDANGNLDFDTSVPTQLLNVEGTLNRVGNDGSVTNPLNEPKADVTTGQTAAPNTPEEIEALRGNNKVLNKAATMGDVLNTGFNLQNNDEAKDFVRHADTVNFVDGTGTTVVVDTDAKGLVSKIKVNTVMQYTDKDGNPVAKADDGKYYPIDPATGKPNKAAAPVENPQINVVNAAPADGKTPTTAPTVLSNVNSGLKPYTATDAPDTNKKAEGLVNLDKNAPNAPSDNNVATVGDLRNMGWIVSSDKTTGAAAGETTAAAYANKVTNAKEVRFVGTGAAIVSGKDDGEVRTITVHVKDPETTGLTVVPSAGIPEVPAVPADPANNVVGSPLVPAVPATDAGKVLTPAEPNRLVNAQTVANAINNSGFKATIGTDTATFNDQAGKTNDLINPGDTLTFQSGKNLKVKQDSEGKFTYATKDDVEFNNVQVNNAITLGSTPAKPAVPADPATGTPEVPAEPAKPAVKFEAQAATPATNNEEGKAPKNALNIAPSANEPVQIVGVGSTLNKAPIVTNSGSTPTAPGVPSTADLIDLKGTPEAPVNPNAAATVGDLQNFGWIVEAENNGYKQAVKNAQEVNFRGVNGVEVKGKTEGEKYVLEVGLATGSLQPETNNPSTPTDPNAPVDPNAPAQPNPPVAPTGKVEVANNPTGLVTADNVAKAINASGFTVGKNTTPPANFDDKDELVNPGDDLRFADGKNTTVKIGTTKDEKGKSVTTVKVDVADSPIAYTDANGNKVAKADDGKYYPVDANGNPDTKKPALTEAPIVNIVNPNAPAGTKGDVTTLGNIKGNLQGAKEGDISPTSSATAPTNPDAIKNNAATVGDVLNAGWNLQGNGVARDFVKPYDTVNFANGTGTVANVTSNGTVSTVKFDVKVDNTGAGTNVTVSDAGIKVDVKADGNTITTNPQGQLTAVTTNLAPETVNGAETGKIAAPSTADGGKLVNATTVANAINNAGWVATVGQDNTDFQNQAGKEDKVIKPSNKVSFNAGKNLKVKQNNTAQGTEITYALENNVDLGENGSIKAGGVEINNQGINAGGKVISNVAPGTKPGDAVNVKQLEGVANNLNNKINRQGKDLRAGIAGANAAAGLPQVYIPGKSMVAASAGTFKGQSAVAVGYSRASDNGKLILKLQGNANTRGDFGGSVGVGYQW
ncbi:YadA-like family protein [Ursidibacter maritimus]|uniref:YadA-like family protein n=1 Tax=Ursidibacter maritimus TaxID=1331689 RepID=UPI001C478A1E|nr:YadA-like family protein [Ursidibacter maritimus]MBV6540152.1 YadA-like family protein [Ursidibacter maritimus]